MHEYMQPEILSFSLELVFSLVIGSPAHSNIRIQSSVYIGAMESEEVDADVKVFDNESTSGDDSSEPVDEAALMRKIDIQVIPTLCVLYMMTFLDRCVNYVPNVQAHTS